MKRKTSLLLISVLLLWMLTGCGCDHQWEVADCTTPKTCSLCGETEGAPLGHIWNAATCTEAQTCQVCKVTEGAALGHSWQEAGCTTPKTCATCKLTEGEALGHTWKEATTEAPKTCETCAATEGERIVTDPRFTTADCQSLFGNWKYSQILTGEDMGIPELDAQIKCLIFFEFGNDGSLTYSFGFTETEAFSAALVQYLEEVMYAEFSAEGYSKEVADAEMKAVYGMTVPEYAASQTEVMMESLGIMEGADFEIMVYYVEGNQIFTGFSWSDEMEPMQFTVNGDQLTLIDEVDGEMVFTRVTE